MTDTPAEKTLRNVLTISAIDGWSVTLFAGFCTLVSLAFGEWVGVYIGALITTAGVIELRGRRKLLRGDANGMNGLVRAQVVILATIGLYAFRNLLGFDEATIMEGLTSEMRTMLDQYGVSIEKLRAMLKPVYYGLYLVVIGLTLLFQGGLALFYHSRKAKVSEALAARQPVPPALPTF
jgi:hypothetical protein